MRKIYIAVTAIFILSVAVFIYAFIYLDSSKRHSFEYAVALDGVEVGVIRVNKFITEDRLVYKSDADLPMLPLSTQSRSRLDLDRKYTLMSYTREILRGTASDFTVLESSDGLTSCLSRYRSRFAFVDNIPAKKGTFVFEEDSPMTYLPIIENYDFSIGRSQVFSAITCPTPPDAPMPYLAALPPISRFVTLTSIKDEYLKIDSRKIKTENLILKIRNYPQGAVWIAKSDRALIKIDLPSKGMTITRIFRKRGMGIKGSPLQDPRYISENVAFKSGGIDIAGKLTAPTRPGRFPAVLLAGGSFPGDADLGGSFETIADYLSKNGYCVLRFDRRGIGASGGDRASTTSADDFTDTAAALDNLRARPSVDADRIFIIGHAEGALHAMMLAPERPYIKGIVLMAPSSASGHAGSDVGGIYGRIAEGLRWSDSYLDLVLRSARSTKAIADDSAGDWASILGRKIFLKSMREEPADLSAAAAKVTTPTLMLQGRMDLELSSESSGALDQAFIRAGRIGHILRYYGDLGYYLGRVAVDKTGRIRFVTDERVLRDTKEWLDRAAGVGPKD